MQPKDDKRIIFIPYDGTGYLPGTDHVYFVARAWATRDTVFAFRFPVPKNIGHFPDASCR